MGRHLLLQMIVLFSSLRVQRNQIMVQMLMQDRFLNYYIDFCLSYEKFNSLKKT
uniref:Uncharacterized protein n=1 Tax=Sphenodon punctatus TaxID=8508 RepID=A0A8D0G541_SPHPU